MRRPRFGYAGPRRAPECLVGGGTLRRRSCSSARCCGGGLERGLLLVQRARAAASCRHSLQVYPRPAWPKAFARRPATAAIVSREATGLWEDADCASYVAEDLLLQSQQYLFPELPKPLPRRPPRGSHDPSQPVHAVARCTLCRRRGAQVQPPMNRHSAGMTLSAAADGGIMKASSARRSAVSRLHQHWTAPAMALGRRRTYLLGHFSLEVSEGHGLLISRGGWVASSTTSRSTQVGRPPEPDGRRGRLHRARHRHRHAGARLLRSADIWDLAPGERFILDTTWWPTTSR